MAERMAKSKDNVVVYGTGLSRFLPKGKATTVHRLAGEKLVASGKATLKKEVEKDPFEKPAKKGK